METVSSSATAAVPFPPHPLLPLLSLLLRQVQRVCHVAFDLLGAPTVGCCQRGRSLLNFLNKIIVAYFSARTEFSHVCRCVCLCMRVCVCVYALVYLMKLQICYVCGFHAFPNDRDKTKAVGEGERNEA